MNVKNYKKNHRDMRDKPCMTVWWLHVGEQSGDVVVRGADKKWSLSQRTPGYLLTSSQWDLTHKQSELSHLIFYWWPWSQHILGNVCNKAHWLAALLLRANRGQSSLFLQPTNHNNNMSKSLTQSASGILSIITTCQDSAKLSKWMVKQPEWKKRRESNLKKKSLGDLQNMCTVHWYLHHFSSEY